MSAVRVSRHPLHLLQSTFLAAVALALVCLLMSGPAQAQSHPDDPFESMNRKIYAFNKTLDGYLIRPVAVGYRTFVPRFMRLGVRNVFNNLGEIRVVANDVLQLKMKDAANDSGRFLINSTLGLAGLIDVATEMGLERNDEDFGQTLGRWGVSSGPYLVVPFFGSATLRDGLGMIPDAATNPVWWIPDDRTRLSIYALSVVELRSSLLDAEQMIRGDEYTFVRDAYLQRREYLVTDGQSDDDWDDWDDWDEDW